MVQLHDISIDATKIPRKPSRSLDPEDRLPDHVISVIHHIREFMHSSRPIVTPRVLLNLKTRDEIVDLDTILPYCGYSFKTGPWANTLIKFGLDPRQDPKYRFFQTVEYNLTYDTLVPPDCQEIPQPLLEQTASHEFSGKVYDRSGTVWQYCDIYDDQLRRIITTSPVRDDFSADSGFFYVATVIKIHVILEDKILCLRDGEMPKDEIYEGLVGFDDRYEFKLQDANLYGLDPMQAYFSQSPQSRYLQERIIRLCKSWR